MAKQMLGPLTEMKVNGVDLSVLVHEYHRRGLGR